MIPFKNRFHGHSSLSYVYKNGQAVHSHPVTIKYAPNPHRQESRVAVVVSKKTLKSAVRRNLIRRRLYEYIRGKLPSFNNVYDMVIIVTSSDFINLTHPEMSHQIDQLFNQAGVQKANKRVPKNT